ncbi:MAG: 50S ribosomal protein L6 [Gemmatimonadetes bacterium]|nr:50S ribosomal protein L6 [Gemmatimonadota bacterium]
MSRIGKVPVPIPDKVEVRIEGSRIRVQGPLGSLEREVPAGIRVVQENGSVAVQRTDEGASGQRALHGLVRSLIRNMVEGVTQGFSRRLEIVGVGYKAEKRGNGLVLTLGYSHPIEYTPPAGVDVATPSPTAIEVRGTDREAVGQTAAIIRKFRPPEPYKGKGIKYAGEQVRRKAGKTAGK